MNAFPTQKAFNATPEGQLQMFRDADSIGTALYINRVVKQKSGTGWDESMIQSANPILLRAIKENLIEEFNSLVSRSDQPTQTSKAEVNV